LAGKISAARKTDPVASVHGIAKLIVPATFAIMACVVGVWQPRHAGEPRLTASAPPSIHSWRYMQNRIASSMR